MILLFFLGALSFCEVKSELFDFKFTQEPTDKLLNNGEIDLLCTYSLNNNSNLRHSVEWFKDSQLIKGPNENRLVVKDPSATDEGLYQCQVKVHEKDKLKWVYLSRKANIRFVRLGHFIRQPNNQKVFVNQSVAFKCSLTNDFSFDDKKVEVEWYNNNHRVVSGSNGAVIVPISHSLHLSNVQKTHSGNYKCVVKLGDHSVTSQTAVLVVIQGVVPSQVVMAIKPNDVSSKVGGTVIMECLANGNPKPLISWFKANQKLVIDNKHIKHVGVDRSSIIIENVTESDAANYKCKAENGKHFEEQLASLTVVTPPVIVKGPMSLIKTETEDVEFDCIVNGTPKPKVSWLKNGEVIVPSEYFVIEDRRLKISGLIRDDEGVYQCFADNDYGSEQGAAQLVIEPAAVKQALSGEDKFELQAPNDVVVQSIGGRSVRLKWSPPIGTVMPDSLEYIIFYRAEEETKEQVHNTTSPSATLLSLKPDTSYRIRVAAVDNMKVGVSSPEITVTTKTENITVGKVRNLQVKVLGSNSAEINWEPPSDVVGGIKYRLCYKKLGSSSELETQSVVVKNMYTLHGLDKNSLYSVRVESIGPNGQGKSSDELQFRTYTDVPDAAPTEIKAESVGSTVITLKWNPPPESKRNGEIVGYRIRYKTKGSKPVTVNTESTNNEYQLENLHPNAQYQVRVAAQTQNGTGTFSEWTNIQTQTESDVESIPGAPSELQLYSTSDSIHLTWSPPQHTGILIRNYMIGWGLFVPDIDKTTVDGNSFQYTISNLMPGREYVVSVRAVNNAGTGFPIYETIKTQDRNSEAAPFPAQSDDFHNQDLASIVGVQAESVSDASIRVTWSDPSYVFNQMFSVRYSSTEDSSQFHLKNITDTEVVIENLQPNTQYEFAVSRAGTSQWSMSTLCKTFPAPPSSSPRDLTVVPNPSRTRQDPTTVSLNWQPPKYANGEIEEYIILYSDRLEVPDQEWIVDSVKGDRLSMTVENLLPKSTYYFKIQARNAKGYSPLSHVVTYLPGHIGYNTPVLRLPSDDFGDETSLEQLFAKYKNYIPYIIIVFSCTLITALCCLTVVCCFQKCRSGTKSNNRSPTQNDCWIAHPSNRVELFDVPNSSTHELKRLTNHTESPIPHYQALQVRAKKSASSFGNDSRDRIPTVSFAIDMRNQHRKSLPPTLSVQTRPLPSSNRGILRHPVLNSPENIRSKSSMSTDSAIMTQSSYETTTGWDVNVKDALRISSIYALQRNTENRASEDRNSVKSSTVEGSTNGTVPRNYNHSSISLESRQRTPQILYTGSNRQQISRVELASDKGSSFGGSTNGLPIGSSTPPVSSESAYQTVRSTNPLRSFANINAPPPNSGNVYTSNPGLTTELRMASVRPVVAANSSILANRSATKLSNTVVPIGRAQAQPRVNLSNYSAASSMTGSREDCSNLNGTDDDHFNFKAQAPLSSPNKSFHDNLNQVDIDDMINQLAEIQQGFQH